MILSPAYPGDDADDIQRAQHDVYRDALSQMVHIARSRWFDAEALLRTETSLGAAARNSANFDHHVIQDAHDILAAIWRRKMALEHPVLPVPGRTAQDLGKVWLAWLANWVREASPLTIQSLLSVAYTDPAPGHPQERLLLGTLANELLGMLPPDIAAQASPALLIWCDEGAVEHDAVGRDTAAAPPAVKTAADIKLAGAANAGACRTVILTQEENGGLAVRTYDVSDLLERLHGNDEMEAIVTLTPDAARQLLTALLQDWLRGHLDAGTALKQYCESRSIPNDFCVWT